MLRTGGFFNLMIFLEKNKIHPKDFAVAVANCNHRAMVLQYFISQ
jgi:hypothetical protein